MKKIIVCFSLLLFISGCTPCFESSAPECLTERDKVLGRQYKARMEAGEFTNHKKENK